MMSRSLHTISLGTARETCGQTRLWLLKASGETNIHDTQSQYSQNVMYCTYQSSAVQKEQIRGVRGQNMSLVGWRRDKISQVCTVSSVVQSSTPVVPSDTVGGNLLVLGAAGGHRWRA